MHHSFTFSKALYNASLQQVICADDLRTIKVYWDCCCICSFDHRLKNQMLWDSGVWCGVCTTQHESNTIYGNAWRKYQSSFFTWKDNLTNISYRFKLAPLFGPYVRWSHGVCRVPGGAELLHNAEWLMVASWVTCSLSAYRDVLQFVSAWLSGFMVILSSLY